MKFTAHGNAVFFGGKWFDTCATESEAKTRADELNEAVRDDPRAKRPTENDLKK